MSSPFVAEIRIFGCNFAPTGWAQCNGQLLPISQNTALFSLLGTYYGGDGKSTFGLPNLQGAAPLHWGQGPGLSLYDIGQMAGERTVTLLQSEIPMHFHATQASSNDGNTNLPLNNIWAKAHTGKSDLNMYGPFVPASADTMNFQAAGIAGGSQPHNNMPPYLVLNFCIAMQGVFPPRS
jgi:microcystin-dependent protein